MRSPSRLLALALAPVLSLALTSCSSNGTPTVAVSPSLTGNWAFRSTSTPASASQINGFGGALAVSSTGAITGKLHALPAVGAQTSALCYANASAIPVTGTMAADNTLTLTSSSFSGNTLTVRGTFVAASGTTPSKLTNATYTVSGPCGIAAQAISALAVPVLTGSWTGSATLGTANPQVTPFSTTFTQASTPGDDGSYTVTGTASFASDPCIISPVSTSITVLDNLVQGDFIQLAFQDNTTGTIVQATAKSTDFTGNSLNVYTLVLGNNTGGAYSQCNDVGTATLTKSAS